MNYLQLLATLIFLAAFALIASERIDKTRVALAGAALMLVLHLVRQQTAFSGSPEFPGAGVDWNTIFLLFGTMIIVAVARHTGLFEWLAVRSAKLVGAHPVGLILVLSLVTAVISAFLKIVTTVLLIVPVVLVVTRALETDPIPFVIPISIASNIGGTATLIGHPPNIMIGSAAGFTFVDFLRYDFPPTLLVFGAFCLIVWLALTPRLRVSAEDRARVLALADADVIRDPRLLRKCLFVLTLAIVGFVVCGYVGLEPATVALAAGVLLLLMLGNHPHIPGHEGEYHWYADIEWSVLLFFIGLFVMVSALVELGVVQVFSRFLVSVTGGNTIAMALALLWFSAIMAGLMDNIPFVATMNAMLLNLPHQLARTSVGGAVPDLHGPQMMPLWWALSLGACLGANFTIIGSATHIVTAGLCARDGHPISFRRFLKYGIPITVVSILICTLYLWFRFLRVLPPGLG
jgi:Na+/H+ antiporter NhaD/arsenite permease-like protein